MVFQERTYSVLIVTASDSFVSSVMPLFPVTDYWPVTTVRSFSEARRRIVETDFDIVLPMPRFRTILGCGLPSISVPTAEQAFC